MGQLRRTCALVAVLALAAGCAGHSAAQPGSAGASASGAHPVALTACADPAAADKLLLSSTAPGPAADAITGQRVTTAFALEGRFSAAPPPAGYTPAVTAEQAACQLTSLYSPNGFGAGPGRLALATVTIDGAGITSTAAPAFGTGLPGMGTVATYEKRIAWILVSAANNDVSSCPMMRASSSPAPSPSGIEADPYEVFVIDAATGVDAVLFEDSYVLCSVSSPTPPSVTNPPQRVSVPWTEVSRLADGSSGVISASWPDCEDYVGAGSTYSGAMPSAAPKTALQAWVSETPADTVSVDLVRTPGSACAAPVTHEITVHPARVGRTLPATIVHAAVGVETSQS